MKTTKKALLLVLCAVFLVAASVLGTIAYFTDSEAVKNTFTVGKVYIDMDETDIDGGEGARTHEGNTYENIIPGGVYVKDPTVTVLRDSDECYVRMLVKVENIDQLKKALPDPEYYGADGVFLLQNLVTGWDNNIWVYEGYTADGNNGTYEFRYYKTVADREDDAGQQFDNKLEPLFTQIKVPGEIDNTHLAYLNNVKIDDVAHAIQAAGFDTADQAWAEWTN